ncbi:serine/threonine-protein kinase Nek7-like [Oppia nitens]|uniref:serine/threonine-protein kinase Nek7-like n=1 Tax=Oppia nitens TaxID=1686743 RepID=UPI0023DB1DCE|nr:serine/threonine-protein kinase Nek7-like [Oppia nitens]
MGNALNRKQPPPAAHVVDPQYRAHYLRDRRKQVDYVEDYPKDLKHPYGVAKGRQFEKVYKWDKVKKQFRPRKHPIGKVSNMPVQGPANWDQLWLTPWEAKKDDYSDAPEVRPPRAEHVVDPEYRSHLADVRKDDGIDYTDNFPRFLDPYGVGKGYEFNDLYDFDARAGRYKQKQAVTAQHRDLPIQGPANWDQLWPTYDDVGTDYEEPIPRNRPLPDFALNYLKEREGNIKFHKQLGKGMYGTVWKVSQCKWVVNYNRYIRYRYACKVLVLRGFGNLHYDYNILLVDIHQLRYLHHPYITRLDDCIGIPDRKTGFPYAFCLVLMELCDEDLEHIIDSQVDQRIGEQHCKRVVQCVASALQYLHSMRVVHQDIKPANIMYHRATNAYKLGDFGLAECFPKDRAMMHSNYYVGTAEYMAPEVGNANVSCQPTDVYSLGATMVHCLLSHDILEQNEFRLHIPQLRQPDCQLPNPPQLSDDVCRLIMAMTEENPRNRPNINQVVNDHWLQ